MPITDSAHFDERPFPSDWHLPDDLTGRIFIGGLRENRECYYLIDFAQKLIKSCIVQVDSYVSALSGYIEKQLVPDQYPYACGSSNAVAYCFVQPHEALELEDGRVVVGMHNCSYAREIEFSQRHVGHVSEQDGFVPRMMSAQNSLDRDTGEYLYTMTDMQQRLRAYGAGPQELDTELYALDTCWQSPRKLASLHTLEALHEVKQSPDPRYLVLTEFCLAANVRPPCPEGDPFADPMHWQAYQAGGLQANRIYLVDKSTGQSQAQLVAAGTPGHIEFSRTDPSRFYLSCHNLSKAHGKLILHGQATLIAGTIREGVLNLEDQYRPKGLYRLTSHKLFIYQGEHYIVLSAYPNRFHIVRERTLQRTRDEQLFEHESIAPQGLHFCTLLGHMPLWIETSDNGRYVLLVSNELIYVYDMRHRTLRHVRGYSHHGAFSGTAHLSNFNDEHY
ncbi:hypothetical protein [Pseudomonas soli]|uniref:hypothetical protein n=1 Tax=Pseudomonas soli TaxID=1306993 RepID=UPI0037F54332